MINDEELRDRTEQLPRSIEPAHDLWPGIAARIEHANVVDVRFGAEAAPADERPAAGPGPLTHGSWRQWGLLAAAAMLLVAVSSGLTAYLVRSTTPEMPAAGAPVDFATVAWDEFLAAERAYQDITADLLAALEAERDQLAPETVRIVEENLGLIDQAIADARTALERDPANAGLATKLTDMYRKRVAFLREMSRL